VGYQNGGDLAPHEDGIPHKSVAAKCSQVRTTRTIKIRSASREAYPASIQVAIPKRSTPLRSARLFRPSRDGAAISI